MIYSIFVNIFVQDVQINFLQATPTLVYMYSSPVHLEYIFVFKIIVNSSLEYFSLVLNTIPRKTM